jgi:hypothetical protein
MFVAMVAVASVVPVSLLVSMVPRVATRTVDLLPRARASDFRICLGPPRVERSSASTTDGRDSIMEIIHSRCAGMDASKRDAKVCVRVAGTGRHKTVDTVHVGSRQHLIIAVGRQRPAITGPAESCGIEISATDRSPVPDRFGSCPYG